jgi:hypothetical protein
MKVEFLCGHTHAGQRYNPGDVVEVPDGTLVKLISRGVAKKHKSVTFKKASPKIEVKIETSIGDTDGPATNE